ncbi:MAG: hypothetical protein AAF614_12980 [Chloroflexota bacterium]
MAATLPPLQPLGMGQILDRAIRLYRQNFLSYLGIIAVAQIPVAIVTIGFASSVAQDPFWIQDLIESGSVASADADVWLGTVLSVLLFVIGIALYQFSIAAVSMSVAKRYVGEEITILDAYRQILAYWRPLVWAVFLNFFIAIGILVWTIVPCIGWFTGLGMLMMTSLAIFPFVMPIIVLEHRSAVDAYYRAWGLVRHRFWWVLGFMLLVTMLVQFIIVGPTSLINLLLLPLAGSTLSPFVLTVVQQTVSFVFQTIVYPVQIVCIVLLYLDLRVRMEAFDLTLQANDEAAVGDLAVFRADGLWLRDGSLITGTELGYFALITLGFFALYFIIILVAVLIGFGFAAVSGF